MSQIGIAYDAYDCRLTYSARVTAAKMEFERIKNQPVPHRKASPSSNPLDNDPQLDAFANQFKAAGALGYEESSLKNCIPGHIGYSIFTIALGVVGTIILWCVCFILGGSFWKPPKIQNQAKQD
ncbi:hypothetical protein [Chromobacterium amazonense]|uniref:PepSY domain-containing protein n=1 Tax=Chromobacterium amazonense TaxID=1382803 RepID=A0ABU8V2T3_9NEIS|nr:hypothetical protein [Chromobacterium amazonense]MDQ4541130.1 hypothetical protein [Chromobacterium amazonense]